MADAYEGYALANGIKKKEIAPPSREEREELHRKIRERERRKSQNG